VVVVAAGLSPVAKVAQAVDQVVEQIHTVQEPLMVTDQEFNQVIHILDQEEPLVLETDIQVEQQDLQELT
jgi:hypothetical protein